MDLAHRRLTPDFTFYMFLVEVLIASAVIYACITFGLFVFLPGVFLRSRVTGACPVTTDLIMRVNVRTTATTSKTFDRSQRTTRVLQSTKQDGDTAMSGDGGQNAFDKKYDIPFMIFRSSKFDVST